MDDEKKMTLGAEKEKQFHSRFPFFPFVPATYRPPLVRSPLLFFSPDTRRPCSALTIRHERERGRQTRPVRDPHEVVTIVIYISFLFISMTTLPGLQAVKRRGVVNDRKDRILCASCFRSSRYSIESFQQKGRSHSTLFTSSSWLSSRYIKSQNEIKM